MYDRYVCSLSDWSQLKIEFYKSDLPEIGLLPAYQQKKLNVYHYQNADSYINADNIIDAEHVTSFLINVHDATRGQE